MANLKLFLGPSNHLIQPIKLKNKFNQYGQQKVPFGYFYQDSPFKIIRKASYLEIYIYSKYRLCKPKGEEWGSV